MAKRNSHIYSIGRYSFEGASKTEAKQVFQAAVADYCEAGTGMHVENRFGSTLIVWRDLCGWDVRTIWNDQPLVHGEYRVGAACGMSGEACKENALQSARMGAAQNAWTPDCDDAAHVAASGLDEKRTAELQGWIAWQRRYAEFRAQGHSESDCYDFAHGLRQSAVSAA